MEEYVVCLFTHTAEGDGARRDLLEAGVPHEALRVIGDLGPATGEAGAEHHVTFDRLHVPREVRGLLMDTIRGGGVMLAVDAGVVSVDEVYRVAEENDVLRVLRTSNGGLNPSHNAAR